MFEKYRIGLSRLAAIVMLSAICSSSSYWEIQETSFTFFLFCLGVILVAIASLGRMWCSLYIAGYKDDMLITKGPYSLCRNPLYFFSMVGGMGIGFATETITFPLSIIVFFALYYPFVIKSEERRLGYAFGISFEEYKKRVPAFFPIFSNFEEPEKYVVNPIVYRKHIFSALWFIWVVGIIEIVEGIKELGWLPSLWIFY